MGVGICLGSCCGDPPCVQLRNCKTEEVITTRSDLHIYEVGDVLLRHDDEEGGCWAILAFGAECDEEPQEFTPVGDPFTGETACQDCLDYEPHDDCLECGDDPAILGIPGVTVDWNFTFYDADDVLGGSTTYLGNGVWQATTTDNEDNEIRLVWSCPDGGAAGWQCRLFVNDIEQGSGATVTHQGDGVFTAAFAPDLPGGGILVATWHHTLCNPECLCCGESCAAKASGTWGFFILNEESSQGESCLEDIPLPSGPTGWSGASDDCGVHIEFDIYCQDGQWLLDIAIGAIVNLTEVPVQGPGSWAIFWSDSQADYRGQFGCCPDVMEVPADSVGIAVNIPECPR